MYGDKDEGIILDKKQKIRGGIELKINDESIINKFPPFEFKKFVNFSVYGASRLNKNSKPINNAKTYSLFNSYADLLDIEDKLIMWEMDKEQRKYFISARKILLQLMSPYVKDIKVERSGSKNRVVYKETDCKEFKEFSELASGFKSIITMIGDMIIRLSENQSEITNFNELAGIVIIDELDLHLHPKMQRNLVEKLTELFPRIQFIASTHSPIPILGAPKNTIIINVQRSKEKGITADKLNTDFTRLLPNSILSSPIFDFEQLIPKSKPKNQFPHTEDYHKDIVEKENLQNELAEFLTPERTNELLNLLKIGDDEKDR